MQRGVPEVTEVLMDGPIWKSIDAVCDVEEKLRHLPRGFGCGADVNVGEGYGGWIVLVGV
jgi:hypothetical protein